MSKTQDIVLCVDPFCSFKTVSLEMQAPLLLVPQTGASCKANQPQILQES